MKMKTLATKIKIGQIIKFGNAWGKVVSSPVQSRYRANEVDVEVVTLPVKVRRRATGRVDNYTGGVKQIFSYRKTTNVTIK